MFAATQPPTPTRLDLAADLTVLLSRQALSDYSLACDAAQAAAERCGSSDRPPAHALDELRKCRTRVLAAEATLNLVVDALATREDRAMSLDAAGSDLLGTLVRTALDRLSADFEASEEDIVATATRIQRLRALLDELTGGREHPVR